MPMILTRDLGVLIDEKFNFRKHISQICRTCYYHIHDLRRICRYLPLSIAKAIATALVSRRLDYWNSLYHYIFIKGITKLQRVQNCLTRVLLCRFYNLCIGFLYHIISYHIISYHIISYHIISYHIISYHIIYHIIS